MFNFKEAILDGNPPSKKYIESIIESSEREWRRQEGILLVIIMFICLFSFAGIMYLSNILFGITSFFLAGYLGYIGYILYSREYHIGDLDDFKDKDELKYLSDNDVCCKYIDKLRDMGRDPVLKEVSCMRKICKESLESNRFDFKQAVLDGNPPGEDVLDTEKDFVRQHEIQVKGVDYLRLFQSLIVALFCGLLAFILCDGPVAVGAILIYVFGAVLFSVLFGFGFSFLKIRYFFDGSDRLRDLDNLSQDDHIAMLEKFTSFSSYFHSLDDIGRTITKLECITMSGILEERLDSFDFKQAILDGNPPSKEAVGIFSIAYHDKVYEYLDEQDRVILVYKI